MNRYILISIALGLLLSAQFCFGQSKNIPLTGQHFVGEVTVQAAPEKVWEILTNTGQLTDILGYEFVKGTRKFETVGDYAQVKVWGDAGNFLLVRADQAKELRFSLDPENGSYICSCRWVLTPSGNGTTVRYEERYTESAPQSPADVAVQVKDTNEKFNKLKLLVENNRSK
jgi:uncharacterized protein YndB with AHSA1/START domain